MRAMAVPSCGRVDEDQDVEVVVELVASVCEELGDV